MRAQEILPAGSLAAWDLSDLQGANIVDDMDCIRGQSDLNTTIERAVAGIELDHGSCALQVITEF